MRKDTIVASTSSDRVKDARVSLYFRLKPARKIAAALGPRGDGHLAASRAACRPNDRGCLVLPRSILRHDAKLRDRRATMRGVTVFNRRGIHEAEGPS
jgi:hypothetical protein